MCGISGNYIDGIVPAFLLRTNEVVDGIMAFSVVFEHQQHPDGKPY